MKIGLCAWSFTGSHRETGRALDPHQPEGLLDLARRCGLASIEGASAWFESWSSAQTDRFRARLEGAGLGLIVDTGAGQDPVDLSPLARAVEVAARLGAPVVRTTVSHLLEGDRRAFGSHRWRAHLESLVEPLKRVAAQAGSAGVAIGVENHQDLCSHELVWLCEQVGDPRLGVTMDVGNAYAVGETPVAFARRVLPYLKHVHLKDYTAHPTESGYRLKRCALGAGLVDWAALLALLDATGPQVGGCIELGAVTARHIRLFEPSWWETYPQRPFVPDAVQALGDLHRAARPPEEDWRTPHERQEPAAARAAYELEQLEASVSYLRSLSPVARP